MMQNTKGLRLTVYNFQQEFMSVCIGAGLYFLEAWKIQDLINEVWSLCDTKFIDLEALRIFLHAEQLGGKGLGDWFASPARGVWLGVCGLWSSGLYHSLNMHRSLRIGHFWREKNFNFDRHALCFGNCQIWFLKSGRCRCGVNFGRQYIYCLLPF